MGIAPPCVIKFFCVIKNFGLSHLATYSITLWKNYSGILLHVLGVCETNEQTLNKTFVKYTMYIS